MPDEQYEVLLVLRGSNQAGNTIREVAQQVQNLDRNTQGVTTSGRGLINSLNDARVAALGFVGVFAGSQALQIAGELNEIGDAANRAEQIFHNLAGGEAAAAEGLEQLREGTLGIVDDLTLMQRASQLLITGLAENTQQAAEFLELATRLGPAVGASVDEAVSALNSALLNQSYEVLDSLGISAGAVRQRVAELKEEGMGFEEAFRAAVLEQGARAIERLGDAADVARTNVDLLETHAENAAQRVGQFINSVVEGLAGLALDGVDLIGQTANEIIRIIGEAGDNVPGTIPGTNISLSPVQENRLRAHEEIRAFFQAQAILEAANARTDAEIEARRQLEAQTDELSRQEEIELARTALISQFSGTYQNLFATFQRFRGEVELTALAERNFLADFADPSALEGVMNMVVNLRAELDILRQKAEEGLIPEQEVSNFERMVRDAEGMAAALERGAQAFEQMRLSEALGEGTDNPLLSDIQTQVLQELADRGILDEEELQQAADTFRLASGEISRSSISMRDEIIPALARITERLGPQEGAERAAQVEDFLRRATLAGLDPNSPVFQLGMNLSTGTLFGGAIDFQTPLELIRDRINEIRNEAMPDAENKVLNIGTVGAQALNTGLVDPLINANKVVDEIAQGITDLAEREHVVKLRIDADAPDWLKKMLGDHTLARIVRDEGGIVPGAEPRSQVAGALNPR